MRLAVEGALLPRLLPHATWAFSIGLVVYGTGSALTADLVAPHTALHKGEIMFTSSLDAAAFPAGIPVGRVASFHTSAGRICAVVAVQPTMPPCARTMSSVAFLNSGK